MSQHVTFELTLPLYILFTLKSADSFHYSAMVAEHRFNRKDRERWTGTPLRGSSWKREVSMEPWLVECFSCQEGLTVWHSFSATAGKETLVQFPLFPLIHCSALGLLFCHCAAHLALEKKVQSSTAGIPPKPFNTVFKTAPPIFSHH